MSRPRKRRIADPSAVLAELRRVAEELVTEDDVAEFRPFGWDEEWARARAADQHHRQLVQEWETQHRTPLTVPSPDPGLVEGVDYVRTRAELECDRA